MKIIRLLLFFLTSYNCLYTQNHIEEKGIIVKDTVIENMDGSLIRLVDEWYWNANSIGVVEKMEIKNVHEYSIKRDINDCSKRETDSEKVVPSEYKQDFISTLNTNDIILIKDEYEDYLTGMLIKDSVQKWFYGKRDGGANMCSCCEACCRYMELVTFPAEYKKEVKQRRINEPLNLPESWYEEYDQLVEIAGERTVTVYFSSTDDICDTWKAKKLYIEPRYKVVKKKKLKVGYLHRQTIKPFVSFYPNPSHENITIQYPFSSSINVEIYTLDGHLINHSLLANGEKVISLKGLLAGLYIINILCDGHSIKRDKLLIIN